ncbi:hypothetical protein B0H21DRAFT_420006 [Amylocystis lapponica]|nr:hypothetical protein B0H21DRAFT_420006 [Amylocystis lapponica]
MAHLDVLQTVSDRWTKEQHTRMDRDIFNEVFRDKDPNTVMMDGRTVIYILVIICSNEEFNHDIGLQLLGDLAWTGVKPSKILESRPQLKSYVKNAVARKSFQDIRCLAILRMEEPVSESLQSDVRHGTSPIAAGRPRRDRAVSVGEFMHALFPRPVGGASTDVHCDVLSAVPSVDLVGPTRTLSDHLADAQMHFNHFIKVHQHGVIKRKYLFRYQARGAGVVCGNCQPGIDGILVFSTGYGSMTVANAGFRSSSTT